MEALQTNRSVVRTRTTPASISYPKQTKYSNHSAHSGPVDDAAAGVVNYNSLAETIRSGYGKSHFNHCYHSLVRIEGPKKIIGTHVVQNGGTTPLDCYNVHNGEGRFAYGAHNASIATVKALFTPYTSGNPLRGYAALGMARMQPDLTEISIPNFIYEMKDLRKLFLLWKKNLSVLKNLSGAVLNWNFGWKPLLADLAIIESKVLSFKSALAEWEARAGTIVRKSCTLFTNSTEFGGQFNYLGNSTLVTNYTGRRTASVEAFLRYRPTPVHVHHQLQGLLGFLDTIGFELDPSILWNALPFTFVVDWFLNVGDWLHQFRLDTLELPIQLTEFCIQIKEELSVQSRVTNTFSFGTGGGPVTVNFQGWSSYEKYFLRAPCIPHEGDLIPLGWKTPNLKQFWLGLNLANSLRRR